MAFALAWNIRARQKSRLRWKKFQKLPGFVCGIWPRANEVLDSLKSGGSSRADDKSQRHRLVVSSKQRSPPAQATSRRVVWVRLLPATSATEFFCRARAVGARRSEEHTPELQSRIP